MRNIYNNNIGIYNDWNDRNDRNNNDIRNEEI